MSYFAHLTRRLGHEPSRFYNTERGPVRRRSTKARRAQANQVVKNFAAAGFVGDVVVPRFPGTQGFLTY